MREGWAGYSVQVLSRPGPRECAVTAARAAGCYSSTPSAWMKAAKAEAPSRMLARSRM